METHKSAQNNEVWMLYLGLRKVKQETTAPQHSMKTQKSHTKEFEITTTPQVGTLVTTNCLNNKRTRLNFGL